MQQTLLNETEVCSCPPIASCEVHSFDKTSDSELVAKLRNIEDAVARLLPMKSRRLIEARRECEEMRDEVRAEVNKREAGLKGKTSEL